ncbi:MAG TPA: hypothetical protein VHX43_12080 [Xanthobacteraceae bacterium]|nr:hypothetical protein [Xanthobacteraceae bacterium]
MDFAKLLAGKSGFAFEFGFALAPTTPGRLAVLVAGALVFATAILARFRPRFPARHFAPVILVVFVISDPHRLAVTVVVVLSDD